MRRPDEVKKGLIRQWLSKADDDLGVARHLAAESVYFTAVAFPVGLPGDRVDEIVAIADAAERVCIPQ